MMVLTACQTGYTPVHSDYPARETVVSSMHTCMLCHLHNSISRMFQPEGLPSILLQAADTLLVVTALQQGRSGGRG